MERKWWTLLAVCTATFMLLIDVTIVNVALPDIQSDLDASFSSLQWVIDAYALTLASFLLVAGSIGDRIGRRRVFSFGFGLFTIASFACGLSGDPTVLNFARGVQGMGAAAMFATALALIAQEFEGRERANAIGIWGATVGGSVAIGPLIGGLITEGLGWEWIFFVNVPIGIAAIFLTETKLANVKATDPQPIDWPGLVTFSSGLFLLIFGLIRGNPEGWGSALIVLSLGAAVLLLLAFLVIESRRENAMLDLSLFRVPSFAGVSIVAFALSAGMFAMFLYLTLYVQDVLGYSPLQSGLRFLPITLLSFFVAPIAGRMLNFVPARALMGTGLMLVALGLLLMHGVEVGDSWTTLLPGFLVRGRRDRADQSGHRLGRDRCRQRSPGRYGLRDQQHLPPGGHRDRRRDARRPVPDGDQRQAHRARAAGARLVLRGGVLRRRTAGDLPGACGVPRAGGERGQPGLHRRPQ